MPKWGLSMAQGKVVEWLVPEGTQIPQGAELVEVESEKSVGVVEAPSAGMLRRHVANADQIVAVGGLLAVIADPAVPEEEIDSFVREFAPNDDDVDIPGDSDSPERVNVGSRTLRYLRQGDGANAVLLIHGFSGDLNTWLFNHGALAAQQAVYALDLPGHGQSSKDVGEGSLDELTAVVCDWIDALGLSKLHLVGHSMGGAIALKTALRRSEQVLSCTLIAAVGLGKEIDAQYIDGVVNADRRKELTVHLQKLFADPARASRQLVDDVQKYKRLDGVRDALRRIAAKMVVDGRQADVMRRQLEQLSVPVLVLWGRQDRIIPVSHCEDLPPSVTVHVFEECGHMVQMEAANDVNRIIHRFLEQHA